MICGVSGPRSQGLKHETRGGAFFGIYSLGKESEESLELHRDEDTNVGEELGSDGDAKDDNTDCLGVGSGCGSGIREASSTADL